MTPTQEEPTLSDSLASIPIGWSDPSLGHRLRAAYWEKREVDPCKSKRVSPNVVADAMRRFGLRRAGSGNGRRPKHHQVSANPASWKFTSSEPKVTLSKRSNWLRPLMTTLFENGQLDQYRLRMK